MKMDHCEVDYKHHINIYLFPPKQKNQEVVKGWYGKAGHAMYNLWCAHLPWLIVSFLVAVMGIASKIYMQRQGSWAEHKVAK